MIQKAGKKTIRSESKVKFHESGKEGKFNAFDITKMFAWVPGARIKYKFSKINKI